MIKTLALLTLAPLSAFAQDAAAPAAAATGAGSSLASMLPLLLIFVVFYFLLIRPQQKRHKELQTLQAGLKKGDEVVTSGGAIAKFVREGDNNTAIVEIAPGVEIKIIKSTIASVLSKNIGGTVPANQVKKKDARVKNDNVVPDKESVANDN